jgi:cyanophycin synthetase
VLEGQLTETAAGCQRTVLSAAELPGAFGGRATHVVANALAAIAACRAVGVTIKDIRRALRSFSPEQVNPGRGNVYAVPIGAARDRAGASTSAGTAATAPACPVVLDYGHNAAALRATGEFVTAVWDGVATAALTLPGDRRDDLVIESARTVAAWFGRVVIYEDSDRRGRRPGELRELIATALRQARSDIEIWHAEGPHNAVRLAVELAGSGPVLFIYEKLGPAMSALDAIGATPWPDEYLTDGPIDGRHELPCDGSRLPEDVAIELALAAAEGDTMPIRVILPIPAAVGAQPDPAELRI